MGENTLYGNFYKPALGAEGAVEKGKFDDKLDVADAEIKANKDAKHTQGTDTTLGTLTAGIPFPATQVPSANVNTLDDYEEGIWTPSLRFGGAAVDMTYNTQAGFYTKIGRLVTVTCRITLTAKGSSTGSATLTGLPFASKNISGNRVPVTMYLSQVSFADSPQAMIIENSSLIYLMEVANAGGDTALTNGNFANNSGLYLSATYFTD